MLGVSLLFNDRADRTEKVLALIRNAAAYAENVGLEDVDDIYQTCSEVADILVDNLFCSGIAVCHSVKRGFAVDLVDVEA